MKKRRFTLEEHQALGAELRQMRDRMVEIACAVGNAYSEREAKCADRAARAIGLLRCRLDERVIRENPGESNEVLLNVYYGAAGRTTS